METKIIHKTPIFDLQEIQDDGSIGFNPVKIHSKDWVSIAAVRGSEILTVKQLRYGLMKELVELPCGMVEDGENPRDAALRELREETGIRILDPEKCVFLAKTAANPAFMDNFMYYYYIDLDAVEYEQTDVDLDPHEKLTSEFTPVDEFRALVNIGPCSVFMAFAFKLVEARLSKK